MAVWRTIAGENNWSGLLPNLNSDLRQRIIDCGERVKVIYDSIGEDGLPKHSPADLFSRVGPDKGKEEKLYEVREYIYALADVHNSVDWIVKDRSVWMGYVAVATNKGKEALGRRDILICWRGTQLAAEWLKNAQFSQVSLKNSNERAYVHKGFHSLYTSSDSNAPYNRKSAGEQVRDAVTQLVNYYKEEEISITVTGHSLGAALATLSAADIVANEKNKVKTGQVEKEFMVTAFVFSSPMVGNKGFKEFIEGFPKLHLLHINHLYDFVPELPRFSGFLYHKTGYMKVINSIGAELLNIFSPPLQIITYFHSLENLLQLILLEGGRRGPRLDEQKYYALVDDAKGDLKMCEVPATSGA